ncbi:MAG: aminopeptidase [Flavipsychrobacter sp.]|jgi:hypothetical protein|nr:aminopeptidase [Flavipsychrobacter sp.]
MRRYLLLFVLFLAACSQNTIAQEKRWLKQQITRLSSNSFHGRGYVNKGGEKAAAFIQKHFRELGVLPFDTDSTYLQKYFMAVNTFPGNMYLRLNKKELTPGADYLVDAGSTPYHTEKIKLKTVDLKKVKDSASWAKVKRQFKPHRGYLLKNSDTVSKYMKLSIRSFANEFLENVFIVPKHGKLTWIVRQDTIPATILYVEDTVMPKRVTKAAITIDSKFEPNFKNFNVLGYIPGTEKPDSFIVFTAHYDHLGRMGRHTIFPGAHDNASGTALVLYLAKYFTEHPQKYSVAFMLFSGEEAGLIGSKHYAKSPVFPLEQIRFVVNLDMTGDATNGITVVNADTRKKEFSLLNRINLAKAYVPRLNERTQTRNSDHYSFSEAGVPAIFIYGNGTKPYYHDVFDVAKELSLENIDGLSRLLVDFTRELSNGK